MPSRKHQRAAAFHEAGHAVARAYLGLGATDTEIRPDGSGLSHGTGQPAWSHDYVLVTLAGPFAEARATRWPRYAADLLPGSADDWAFLQSHPIYKAQHLVAERETSRFLRLAWPDIERVAHALLLTSKLPASEVARLVGKKHLYSSLDDFARRWAIGYQQEQAA